MHIDTNLIKELRAKTSLGILDCKKALVETNGDIDAAITLLKKKGILAANAKIDRDSSEGIVAVSIQDENKAGLLSLNCETDFVAKHNDFLKLAVELADLALSKQISSGENLKEEKLSNNLKAQDQISESIAVFGENIKIGNIQLLSLDNPGIISYYIHNVLMAGKAGKIAVLVALESEATDKKQLFEIGEEIAMHISFADPKSINRDDLDRAFVDSRRAELLEESSKSGKNENVVKSMVDGKMNKLLSEIVLMEQKMVTSDEDETVATFLENKAKAIGHPIKITGFARHKIG